MARNYTYHYEHDKYTYTDEEINTDEVRYIRHLFDVQTSMILCALQIKFPRQKKPNGKVIKCTICYDLKNHIKKNH